MQRREFLKTGALWTVAATAALRAEAQPIRVKAHLLPILQGMTDATSAQFKILVDLATPVAFEAQGPNGALAITQLDRFVHPSAPQSAIERIQVHGLEPGANYKLRVKDQATGALKDERDFQALDPLKPNLRFALLSCANDRYASRQFGMWDAVRHTTPDILVFAGDACYVDQRSDGSEAGMWRRHLDTLYTLDVYRWPRLIPIFATWDDHDFGRNDADGHFALKDATRAMFEAIFGSTGQGLYVRGPGVSSFIDIGGQRFFLMDDRSFRNLEPRAGHWGSEQEEWLFSLLRANDKPAWLVNGSQFFGGYMAKAAFENNHGEQFRRVLERMRQVQAPVVFTSGDVHFSEIMRIEPQITGYETYELTSSSIHSFAIPGFHRFLRNPRRQNATSYYNFMAIESERVAAGRLQAKVRSVGYGSATFFERDLTVAR